LTRGIQENGGTRHLLDRAGCPIDNRHDLYDSAFVLFALGEAALALGDRPDLLKAGERLLDWMESHWADPHGGFREGDITPTPPRRQNPHMHVFEALLAMFEASHDQRYLAAAGKLGELFESRFFDAAHGALPEYFDETWRPLASEEGTIAEPGHEFEWSWLLHRWRALGGADFGHIAERLRVHAELYGVDPRSGVVFDEIRLNGQPHTRSSRLWPHTERIKANVARFRKTRDPNAAAAASQAFDVLMSYCEAPVPGLWRDRRFAEGGFALEASPASSFYHIAIALNELIEIAG